MRKNIITGLDIGSSKVCCTIARVKDKGKLDILGTGLSKTNGITRGFVSDLDKLTDSIASSISLAEDSANIKACNIIANAGGPSVKGSSYDGALSLSYIPRIITKRDVSKVINIARDLSVSLGEEPMHLIPLGFTLDNQEAIENPVGLYGVKLKVKLYIITCATNLLRNITRAVNHAGYEVKDIIYSGNAASYVLSEDEKRDGVAVLDIGKDVSELAIFYKDKLRFSANIDIGGQSITEEISSQFKIPNKVAEDLKQRYGTIFEKDLAIDERLNVDADNRQLSIERSSMNYAISAKVKEIFVSLKKQLKASGLEGRLPRGIVMSGSPLLMSGVVETAEKEFGLPVRMAPNPTYATSTGLVKYGLSKFTEPGTGLLKKEHPIEKALTSLKQLLTDYF